MKKLACLLSLMLLVACNNDSKKYIAVVNGEGVERPFFESQVSTSMKQAEQYGKTFNPQEKYQHRQRVMDGLVERQLLLQEVRKSGVTVSEQVISQNFAKTKNSFPNEEAFQKALQENGLTEAEFKKRIEEQMSVTQMVRTQVVDKIVISDQDLKDFYEKNKAMFNAPEQVRASHILIKCEEPKCLPAAKAKLEKVRAEVVAKKITFAEAAQKYSDCPSKARGGDLDFFPRQGMVPEFSKVAFSSEKGKISPLLKTQYGYHILVVTDKKAAGIAPFEEVSGYIRDQLKNEKGMKAVQAYIDNLKKSAKIKTYLEPAPPAPAKAETKPPAATPTPGQTPAQTPPQGATTAPGQNPAPAPPQPSTSTTAPAPGK